MADYNPEQKKIAKQIVRLRKSGLGYPAIANKLNERGVATFGKGKQWYGPTVRHVAIRELGSAEASLELAGRKRPMQKADGAAS